jgi:hypothetical protein
MISLQLERNSYFKQVNFLGELVVQTGFKTLKEELRNSQLLAFRIERYGMLV